MRPAEPDVVPVAPNLIVADGSIVVELRLKLAEMLSVLLEVPRRLALSAADHESEAEAVNPIEALAVALFGERDIVTEPVEDGEYDACALIEGALLLLLESLGLLVSDFDATGLREKLGVALRVAIRLERALNVELRL